MHRYYPGQSFRSKLQSFVEGVLTDPPTPTVTLYLPDGSNSSTTAVQDSVGMWHADFLVPIGMRAGIAVVVWQSVGSQLLQNTVQVRRLRIEAIPIAA